MKLQQCAFARTFGASTIGASVVLATAISSSAQSFDAGEPGSDDYALILAHYSCNARAVVGPLDPANAEMCSLGYLRLKLAFLGKNDLAAYRRMTATEKSRLNRDGYLLFRQWERANASLVERLKALAETGS